MIRKIGEMEMNSFKNILWGIVLVIVGVVVGTNSLGITDIDIFFNGWWTLFIIIPCFIGLFDDKDKMGNVIGLLIGIILLLSVNDIISFDKVWSLLLPIVIVIIGLSLIFKDVFNKGINDNIKKLNNSKKDDNNYFAAFSGQDVVFNDKVFEGASLTCCFGGIKLDLRKANIDKDVLVDCTSIFGGIDILIPDDVNIEIKSTSIFGGTSNKKNNAKGKHTIYVNSLCLFGGVDIK